MKHTRTSADPIKVIELLNELSTPDPRYIELRDIIYNRRNEKMLLELPIISFFQSLYFMTSQKYGFLIQKRIIKDMGYGPPRNKDAGDAFGNDKDQEIKVSLITLTNPSINIRQVRMWQGCDYNILGVDMRVAANPTTYFFKLTHSDMERELVLCKAGKSHTHGEEMSLTINVDKSDEHFNRWCKDYRIPSPWDDELNKRFVHFAKTLPTVTENTLILEPQNI